jgi:hypothetical protein
MTKTKIIATLPLGLRPKQGLVKVQAKREAWELHFMLPGVQENVREWTFTLPSEFPLWELESRWSFKFSKSDCKGQNPLDQRVFYIIEKLLELRCLKWVRMIHLNIQYISYSQKKGQELNWQFDTDH